VPRINVLGNVFFFLVFLVLIFFFYVLDHFNTLNLVQLFNLETFKLKSLLNSDLKLNHMKVVPI